MASSSTVATSTFTRPGVAIAVAAVVATASWGYYYYYHGRFIAESPELPSLGASGSSLHRRNAVRRPRRASQWQDDSSRSESHHGDENADSGASVPLVDNNNSVTVPAPYSSHDDQHAVEWYDDPSQSPRERTGENIVTLLFRVSEDNARRNAYVHRGCLCNGCGMLPIRGIRYRCANCPDYDLCEMCESMGSHNKTHVFYKVKVPVPSSTARHVQPPWYPGDPNVVSQTLPRHLLAKWSHETGFERVELDALWEQWTFMANTEWRDDPNSLCLAMDRKTFERCLVPSAGSRHPAPNLIHDRMFAFYDTNHDDLIGFEEFLHGVAYKKRKDKLKRTFDGYDIDGDGYVSRRDFLRMFRAYYVSYKQMHRDTVEGLDDYMMTNIDVQQLVNSRQPMSSIFGRDQRIPEGDGDRMMEGKVFRSRGEVEVLDGKGPVTEDKPDTSSREDILRDLFARSGNPSLFTESFESSHRPHSPARENPYWSGILNPPRNTVELASLLSGDYPQFDDILDSIRHQTPGIFSADEVETGTSSSSDDGGDDNDGVDDDQSNHDDRMDEEGETSHHSINDSGNSTVSAGLIDARRFVDELPIDMQLEPRSETPGHLQRLNPERRKRVMARKQLLERWKRRQFYLDEEEGSLPPQGWRDDQDILANANSIPEPSKSAPPFLSPRSRSSSKVRFVEDTDDFETRSNPSTSSRSVPERWGGMEIPDAERDAGKEILYQVTQQAFNELLDVLFKKKEDLAVLAAETKEQRQKYREVLDNLDKVVLPNEDENGTTEHVKLTGSQHSPVRRPIQQQSLEELLRASGYTLVSPEDTDESSPQGSNQDLNRDTRNNRTESIQTTAASLQDHIVSPVPEYRDPTMPQFMPNSALPESQGVSTQLLDSNHQPGHSVSMTGDVPETSAASNTPSRIQVSELSLWKMLDQAEQEAKTRGGWGRLSYAEFEEIYREHEFQDGTKNRLAYLGNWIDFCIPS
ncbi:hypothetical protein GGS21DRAFT_503439 [Xylaria nigripes]|nr:hypothetical protein GGS21DRAFT_503439 [Xylaria nigripes]